MKNLSLSLLLVSLALITSFTSGYAVTKEEYNLALSILPAWSDNLIVLYPNNKTWNKISKADETLVQFLKIFRDGGMKETDFDYVYYAIGDMDTAKPVYSWFAVSKITISEKTIDKLSLKETPSRKKITYKNRIIFADIVIKSVPIPFHVTKLDDSHVILSNDSVDALKAAIDKWDNQDRKIEISESLQSYAQTMQTINDFGLVFRASYGIKALLKKASANPYPFYDDLSYISLLSYDKKKTVTVTIAFDFAASSSASDAKEFLTSSINSIKGMFTKNKSFYNLLNGIVVSKRGSKVELNADLSNSDYDAIFGMLK